MPEQADNEELLATLVDEYLEALRAGTAPPLTQYAAEHPECAEELNSLLRGMVDMESLGVTARSPAPAPASYPETLGG